MKSTVTKTAVGLAGTAVLVLSGTASVVAPGNQAIAIDAEQYAIQNVADDSAISCANDIAVSAENIRGAFTFNQDVITSNATIASTFKIATTAMCAAMPAYDVATAAQTIAIGGSAAGNAFAASLDEIESEEEAESYIMGCACSANMPGGSAIVNAEVEGVSISSLMRMAQVQ